MRIHSNEIEFDFHENEPVGGTHFHMNGFIEYSSRILYCISLRTLRKKTSFDVSERGRRLNDPFDPGVRMVECPYAP